MFLFVFALITNKISYLLIQSLTYTSQLTTMLNLIFVCLKICICLKMCIYVFVWNKFTWIYSIICFCEFLLKALCILIALI